MSRRIWTDDYLKISLTYPQQLSDWDEETAYRFLTEVGIPDQRVLKIGYDTASEDEAPFGVVFDAIHDVLIKKKPSAASQLGIRVGTS